MQLYADEDFPYPVVEALRRLGHDVLTTQEDGRQQAPDPDILARAHALGRAVITHNRRHFERLHLRGAHAASSFMSVAIAQVFGSDFQVRCKDRPEFPRE